jgi:hypothetical protein
MDISILPNEITELILEKLPLEQLIASRECLIINNFIIKKYLSINNIFKYVGVLMKYTYYRAIINECNIRYATSIVDSYMLTINRNGGLIRNTYYNGEPINMYLLRIKSKDGCFEIINKFVDTDAQSNGQCFGFSGWGRTVYNRTHLINKLECMFRMSAYSTNNLNIIEIIKINYPNGYDKNINGIDKSSPHEETVLMKYL